MPDQPRRRAQGEPPAPGPAARRDDALAPTPGACTPGHTCGVHDTRHVHDRACGHPALEHGDHVVHEVEGHRHRPHGGHCDDHGPTRP